MKEEEEEEEEEKEEEEEEEEEEIYKHGCTFIRNLYGKRNW